MKAFKSIIQFQAHFNTDDKCRLFLEQQRWGDAPACPHCGSINVTRLKAGKRFQCNEKECRKQFSVTVGTVLENTKVPLTKWFLAMYILSNHSKGISSLQLAEWLDVTQKTAWFLNHRIREMLTENAPEILNDIVEVDETFVGGKASNIHASKRKKLKRTAAGLENKTAVLGLVERNKGVKTFVIKEASKEHLSPIISDNVDSDAMLVTDNFKGYTDIGKNFKKHVTVSHSNGQYVKGVYHTNTIEGFWSLLKRQITGIHHSVSPKHLQRYCNEAGYRYNNKTIPQDIRFSSALVNCEGRLKYNDLVGDK